MMIGCSVFLLLAGCVASLADSSVHKSSLPSPVRYFTLPDVNNTMEDSPQEDGTNHEPRFGFQLGYGNDIQGYSGGSGVSYKPVKLDLGGLVLGAVLGVGAVLLAPKLLHLLSSPSHHSARREDLDVLPGLESSCFEKTVCTLARAFHSTSSISDNTSNPIFDLISDGSKLKVAIDRGLRGEDCADAFPHCKMFTQTSSKENKV